MTTLALLIGLAAFQDPPHPRLDYKLSVESREALWSFVVDGTADLPDGTVLKARLYAVEEIDDYRGGKRIDEESMMHDKLGFRLLTVRGGKLREAIFTSPRKPYSIRYRSKLTYDPDRQEAAVLDKVGEREFSVIQDLRLGDDAAFEKELAAASAELGGEMERVLELYRDLKGRFQVWIRKPVAAEFQAWTKAFLEKMAALQKRNDSRYSIWAVWLERQAKFRIDAFVDRFEGLVHDFEEWLEKSARLAELSKDPVKNAAELKELADEEQHRQLRIGHGIDGFLASFEEAREVMGIDTPWDPESVGAVLKEYEAAVAELAALAARRDAAEWASKSLPARDRARRSLLGLVSRKLIPRRGYDRILDLREKFDDLFAAQERAVKGEGAGLPESARVHAERVAEFRKYAGLK
jgi:hypothetical protein